MFTESENWKSGVSKLRKRQKKTKNMKAKNGYYWLLPYWRQLAKNNYRNNSHDKEAFG